MGKAPAVVIIARHGARLDAADKSWHLGSPTPYDPPLTYGGWMQSRALGLRIASLLNARENDVPSKSSTAADAAFSEPTLKDQTNGKAKQKKRKHKVVIHSSPFQRCVQTGVGISAGLSQFDTISSAHARKGSDTRVKTMSKMHSASPRLRAVDEKNSPKLQPISEPAKYGYRENIRHSLKDQKLSPKPTLRVDAFLGEWLSPDYFELITPPPNSTLMVAGAKADLLRRAENVEVFTPSTPKVTGSLWGTHDGASKSQSEEHVPVESGKTISRQIPRRDRTHSDGSAASSSSQNSEGRSGHFRSSSSHANPPPKSEATLGYTPPQPTYAVSPLDPIPRGYVAHARDACVDIDYHWDSMREPQLWGDGGHFGEEWSAMHKRFRRGLNGVLEWYSEHNATDDNEAVPEVSLSEDVEDDDTDLVLVLVTHGAGCNALIGAFTNQPVLIDVGMASLTMAIKKEGAKITSIPLRTDSPAPSPALEAADRTSRPQTPHQLSLSTVYDMKIVASSEHLRPGVDPSRATMPTPSSPKIPSQNAPEYRRRFGSGSYASAGAPITASTWDIGEPARPHHPALGSVRRQSQAAVVPRSQSLRTSISDASPGAVAGGLWAPGVVKVDSPALQDLTESPISSAILTAEAETDKDRVSPKNVDGAIPTTQHEEVEAESVVSDLPTASTAISASLGRSLSQKGLWGSASSGARNEHASGIAKRRWTLAQETA